MDRLGYNLIHRFNLGDVLRRSAARHPDRVALTLSDRTVTYRELDELSNRFARALAGAGVGRGDAVGFLAPNSIEYIAAFFGCPRIGAALVPINVMYTDEDIDYVLGKTHVKALVVDPSLLKRLDLGGDAVSQVTTRFALGDEPPPATFASLAEAMAAVSPGPVEEYVDNEDAATIIFTSGTTARPKGVVNTNLNWYAALISAVADLGVGRRNKMLLALPLFHSGGLYLTFATIAVGASGVVLPAIDGGLMLEAMAGKKVDYVALPATAWVGLLRAPNIEAIDFSHLKTMLVFQYLPTPVFNKWRELAPNAEWINYWGQTEMIPLGSSTPSEDIERKLAAPNPIGLPHTPLEVRVVDDDMNVLGVGEVGELVARGPSVTPGYFEDDEANEALFRGGWHHTGDMAYRDEEGYLYFVDRKKDMIKTGGENVASQEVEEAIAQLDGVSEVAVVGLSDPYWIERVVAAVVPAAGAELTEEQVIAFARERLAGFKVPKQVLIMDELPKNPTGKILKRVLREQLEKQQHASVEES